MDEEDKEYLQLFCLYMRNPSLMSSEDADDCMIVDQLRGENAAAGRSKPGQTPHPDSRWGGKTDIQ